MSAIQKLLEESIGETRFGAFLIEELRGLSFSNEQFKSDSIFVCGRYGAGKSTFADNWLGNSNFFPASYHIDSDRIMKALKERSLTSSVGDASVFRSAQEKLIECLSHLGVGFAYSFVGKKGITPMDYRYPKSFPHYSELSEDEKIIPKSVGHMILCEQDKALSRVRHRQSLGGHPFRELEGDFEREYRLKQAEIIYGIPLYCDGANKYYIWDSTDDGRLNLVAEISVDDGRRVVSVCETERAEKYGINFQNLNMLFALYEEYPVIYEGFLKAIINGDVFDCYEGDFAEIADQINFDFVERVFHKRAIKDVLESAVKFKKCDFRAGKSFDINPFSQDCSKLEKRAVLNFTQ